MRRTGARHVLPFRPVHAMRLVRAGGTEKPPNARPYLAALRKGLALPFTGPACVMSNAVVVLGARSNPTKHSPLSQYWFSCLALTCLFAET